MCVCVLVSINFPASQQDTFYTHTQNTRTHTHAPCTPAIALLIHACMYCIMGNGRAKCVFFSVRVCVFSCECVCVCVWLQQCICARMHVCVCMWVCAYFGSTCMQVCFSIWDASRWGPLHAWKFASVCVSMIAFICVCLILSLHAQLDSSETTRLFNCRVTGNVCVLSCVHACTAIM